MGCGSSGAIPTHTLFIPGVQRQQRLVSPCKIYSFGCKVHPEGILFGAHVFIWSEWDLGLRLLCSILVPRIPARSSGPHSKHNFTFLEREILWQVSNPLKGVTNSLHYYTTTSKVCWKPPAPGQRAHKWETRVPWYTKSQCSIENNQN